MPDEIDRLTEWQEQALARQLAPHLSHHISEQEALEIASQGRDCAECGLPIGAARLRANPLAFRCIHCQQEAENEWKF